MFFLALCCNGHCLSQQLSKELDVMLLLVSRSLLDLTDGADLQGCVQSPNNFHVIPALQFNA